MWSTIGRIFEKLKRSVYELSREINVAQSNLNKLLKAYNLSSKIDSSIERKSFRNKR